MEEEDLLPAWSQDGTPTGKFSLKSDHLLRSAIPSAAHSWWQCLGVELALVLQCLKHKMLHDSAYGGTFPAAVTPTVWALSLVSSLPLHITFGSLC